MRPWWVWVSGFLDLFHSLRCGVTVGIMTIPPFPLFFLSKILSWILISSFPSASISVDCI